MDIQLVSSDVHALLAASDAELRRLPLETVEEICAEDSGPTDERLWPLGLERLFSHSDPAVRRTLHWMTEIYYGELMRADGGDDFWKLCALAYTRVVRLRLGYDETMGHRRADSLFVRRAVDLALPHKGRPSVRVLDVGCGTGELLADLASFGFTALEGVDVSRAAVERAATRLLATHASVRCMSLRRLIDEPRIEAYDVVTLCDVLEHLPRRDAPDILRKLGRLLAPGGLLVIVTPSAHTGPHDLDFLPRGCGVGGLHLYEYGTRELCSILRQAGYEAPRSSLLAPSERLSLRPSVAAVRAKTVIEPLIGRLPYPIAAWTTERLYFRGMVCRRS